MSPSPGWHGDAADAATAALEAIAALEGAGFTVALGGSLALGLRGVPRGTSDADLNVFADEARHPDGLACLERAGFAPVPDRTAWTAEDRGRLEVRLGEGDVAPVFRGPIRVDLFVPSIPFYDDAERTLRVVDIGGGRVVRALSPEALCVLKLLFFRDKDLVDLRRLVQVRGADLDHAWVSEHLAAMFPDGDERLDARARVVRDHGPAGG